MELLKEEIQKDVSLSTKEDVVETEINSRDLDEESLYDSFRDRFKIDYEDDF